MPEVRILIGDVREKLAELPDESVHCVVTSPPYFGLRDYGTASWDGGDPDCTHQEVQPSGREGRETPGGRGGSFPTQERGFKRICGRCGATRTDKQIGLEPTPAEFVAVMVEVFRDVRRVMRPDATLWLNLGDSYGDKQLLGVPWAVAKALQAPYYTGKIKSEADRIWLAAMIDGEGCFFIHKRKAGSSAHSKFTKADGTVSDYSRTVDTYGVGLEICNTSKAIIDRVAAIVGGGTFTTQGPDQNARRKQTIYRWRIAPNEAKRIAHEVYPHLVSKQHQARLLINCPSTGEPGAAAHQAMMDLHNGAPTTVDYPAPASLFEPGFYLRQDIIWSKCNPMPESVTDRCTKAHEYLFLLSKSARYHYDAEAIKEPVNGNAHEGRKDGSVLPARNGIETGGAAPSMPRGLVDERNRRSVWTVATQPFKEAHFATFPPDLIEPCIKAGCPKDCCAKCGAPVVRQTETSYTNPGNRTTNGPRSTERRHETAGFAVRLEKQTETTGWSSSCACDAGLARGVCLDPFGGAGTTGLVADRLQRDAVLIELNPEYADIAKERIHGDGPLFSDVALLQAAE